MLLAYTKALGCVASWGVARRSPSVPEVAAPVVDGASAEAAAEAIEAASAYVMASGPEDESVFEPPEGSEYEGTVVLTPLGYVYFEDATIEKEAGCRPARPALGIVV